MMLNREHATVFDLLAAELLDLSRRAQDVSRNLSQRQIGLTDLSASTGIINDLGNCLALAKGAKSMLKLRRRQ